MADDIPQRALDKAQAMIDAEAEAQGYETAPGRHSVGTRVLARYIAQYEESPVDPLLIEARELIASAEHPSFGKRIAELRAGKHDGEPFVQVVVDALKRGMELAEKREKADG